MNRRFLLDPREVAKSLGLWRKALSIEPTAPPGWTTVVVTMAFILWSSAGATLAQSEPAKQLFDDPMASLSSEDDLDQIIKQGFKINHLELVIHRCTMGDNKTDKKYSLRKQQMDQLSLLWGAYMYPHKEPNAESSRKTGVSQARHFINEVLKHRKSNQPDRVVLSVSWFWPNDREIAPAPETIVSICQEIHRITATWPLLFVDIDLLESLMQLNRLTAEQKSTLGKCDLWLSIVHSEHDFPVSLPPDAAWSQWTFCLYTAADDPMTKNASSDTIVPDLSYFVGGRGKALHDWYESHAWNYENEVPVN